MAADGIGRSISRPVATLLTSATPPPQAPPASMVYHRQSHYSSISRTLNDDVDDLIVADPSLVK